VKLHVITIQKRKCKVECTATGPLTKASFARRVAPSTQVRYCVHIVRTKKRKVIIIIIKRNESINQKINELTKKSYFKLKENQNDTNADTMRNIMG
jgi:16S rRNA U1498 N3-methylase RsmE